MIESKPLKDHVLLAEDDAYQALLFKQVFEQTGTRKSLSVVTDGQNLMAHLLRYTPELLFLDLNMPYRNGLDCLEEIRNVEVLQNLPVVVYSGSSQMTVIKACYLNKADLYLVKPFNPLHLQHALQMILDLQWLRERGREKFYFMNNRFVPFTS